MQEKDQIMIDLTGLEEKEKKFVEDIVRETTSPEITIRREKDQMILSGPETAIKRFRITMRIALEKPEKPDNN